VKASTREHLKSWYIKIDKSSMKQQTEVKKIIFDFISHSFYEKN
jgi:hypothetical protein